VENYLRRCLDSVLAQTFADWECVLVDDGSPDGCPAICDEYAAKDTRFAVIHQENAGTAHARDAGIKAAAGEFVTFVDSDDWLEKCALELLYRRQCESGADVILGGFRVIYPFGNREYFQKRMGQTASVLVYYLLTHNSSMFIKLYRKALFNNYFIPKTNIGEDDIINIQIFSSLRQEKMQILERVIYNYDKSANGITTAQFRNTQYKTIKEFPAFQSQQWIGKYLWEHFPTPDIKSAYAYHIITLVIVDFLLRNKKIILDDRRYLYNEFYKPCACKKLIPPQYRILFCLFYYFFPLGYAYRFVLKKLAAIKHYLIK
jgi:glycosyltransferase involved in cell wall biosynthesis